MHANQTIISSTGHQRPSLRGWLPKTRLVSRDIARNNSLTGLDVLVNSDEVIIRNSQKGIA